MTLPFHKTLHPWSSRHNPYRKAIKVLFAISLAAAVYLIWGYVAKQAETLDIARADRDTVLSCLNGTPMKSDDGEYITCGTQVVNIKLVGG